MHCLVNLIQFSLIVTFTFIFKFKRETVHFWVSPLFIFLHLLDHNSYQENPILVRPLPSHLIWSIFPEIFKFCSILIFYIMKNLFTLHDLSSLRNFACKFLYFNTTNIYYVTKNQILFLVVQDIKRTYN